MFTEIKGIFFSIWGVWNGFGIRMNTRLKWVERLPYIMHYVTYVEWSLVRNFSLVYIVVFHQISIKKQEILSHKTYANIYVQNLLHIVAMI